MSNIGTPQSSDWNHFWGLDKTGRFTQMSWSKRRIIKILKPFVKEGNKVLDAGCGSGFFSKYFCDQKMETVSLDYSDKALEIARSMTEGRTKIIKEDLLFSNLSEKIEERFDVIFSDGLLEHFSEEHQGVILRNFRSLLSNEGVIITFVPNRWSPWQLIRPFFMPGIEEAPFVLGELTKLHRRNDLIAIDSGGVNILPCAFSPDNFLGKAFGMLLFTIAKI